MSRIDSLNDIQESFFFLSASISVYFLPTGLSWPKNTLFKLSSNKNKIKILKVFFVHIWFKFI